MFCERPCHEPQIIAEIADENERCYGISMQRSMRHYPKCRSKQCLQLIGADALAEVPDRSQTGGCAQTKPLGSLLRSLRVLPQKTCSKEGVALRVCKQQAPSKGCEGHLRPSPFNSGMRCDPYSFSKCRLRSKGCLEPVATGTPPRCRGTSTTGCRRRRLPH